MFKTIQDIVDFIHEVSELKHPQANLQVTLETTASVHRVNPTERCNLLHCFKPRAHKQLTIGLT